MDTDQPMNIKTQMPKPFITRTFHEVQMRGMIDDTAGVGILIIHPDGQREMFCLHRIKDLKQINKIPAILYYKSHEDIDKIN